jgi:hypothetical protein
MSESLNSTVKLLPVYAEHNELRVEHNEISISHFYCFSVPFK